LWTRIVEELFGVVRAGREENKRGWDFGKVWLLLFVRQEISGESESHVCTGGIPDYDDILLQKTELKEVEITRQSVDECSRERENRSLPRFSGSAETVLNSEGSTERRTGRIPKEILQNPADHAIGVCRFDNIPSAVEKIEDLLPWKWRTF
jgi:hypothetical protein